MKRRRRRIIENKVNTTTKTWLKDNWKALLLLALLVFTSYINSLGNGFVSDDITAIECNPEINRVSYFWPSVPFLRPLLLFIIHKFFGLNPAFYRLTNILFHLGSVWVIYIILSILIKPPVALFAASLFSVHPVLSECVTWISGGNYAQYTFFGLISLLFYILSSAKRKFYYLSIIFFILLFLSGERGVVFAGVLAAWEIASGKFSKNWKKTIPFFILASIIVVLTFAKIGTRLATLETGFALPGRSTQPLVHIPMATTNYFQKLFFPKDLTFFYTKVLFTGPEYAIRLIITLFYFGLIIYCYIRKQRFLCFWLAFFIIGLLPVLTPWRVACIVAERYVYLSSIGIFVVVALVFKKLTENRHLKIPAYIVFLLIIIILSARTIFRNLNWKDEEHLWRATLKVSPDSVNAVNNMGAVYLRKNDFENAARQFKKAIELMPGYGDPYNNLALAYYLMGKHKEAIENYQKAVSCNPNFWQAYDGLAVVYFDQKEYNLAKENVLKAIQINPKVPILHTNLGIIYMELSEKEKVKDEFKKALEIDPNLQSAKQLLDFIAKGLNVKVEHLDY